MDIKIKKLDGGYILSDTTDHIFTSLDEVFEWLLLHFEGRAPSFYEDLYGKVTISRGEDRR